MITKNKLLIGKMIAVVLCVAGTILVAFYVPDASIPDSALQHSTATVADPLAAELARCQSIGGAAIDDPGCQDVWAENRRRFFGEQSTTTLPATITPTSGPSSKGR